MKKADLVKLGLTEELAEKVAEASKEEFKGYVSIERFNEVNEQNKSLKAQTDSYEKQLKDFKSVAGDNEALKKKLEDAQAAVKQAKKDFAAEIRKMAINNAIEDALGKAKAKNSKAVRALLDMEKIDFDEETNKITGLSKQIEKLVESEDTKFLFEAVEQEQGKPKAGMQGVPPKDANNGVGGAESIGAQMAAAYNAQFATSADK